MNELLTAAACIAVGAAVTAAIFVCRKPPVTSDAELIHARADAESALKIAKAYEAECSKLHADVNGLAIDRMTAVDTLRQIVGMETPGANATVRRIVQAARAGLPA